MRLAFADDSTTVVTEKKDPYDSCWDGYERVPGKKKEEKGSCRKEGSDAMGDEGNNLWDNIRAKDDRIKSGSGEKKARPGDDDYPETLDVNEGEEASSNAISGKMTEVDEYDENAFVAKAADAKSKGKKKFKMGDKEYDVTIDKETAEEITGEKIEEAQLRKLIRDIILEACYDGRKVTLNKKMSNPENKNKKSKVYVSGKGKYKSGPCKGQNKAKKVQFGDPNMRIRKSNPKARKSFRARHNCDNPGPKDKARYWSCKSW